MRGFVLSAAAVLLLVSGARIHAERVAPGPRGLWLKLALGGCAQALPSAPFPGRFSVARQLMNLEETQERSGTPARGAKGPLGVSSEAN